MISPKLALALCTIFVLFLLRLDRKQSPNVSYALWIPTIWMLLISGKPLGVWFPSWAGDLESGSPLDRNFLLILLSIGLFLLIRKKVDLSSAVKENKWFMFLLGYMLVSILWSDMPFISLKRWTKELVAVVMAFLMFTERDPRQALECLFRRIAYINIPFSILLIRYYTDEYGVHYEPFSGEMMWIGVTLQKNGLGRLCIICVFFLIWTLVKRWREKEPLVSKYQSYSDIFILGLALYLLKGPPGVYPATASIAIAAGLTTWIFLSRIKKRGKTLGKNTLSVIIIAIISFGIITVFVGGSTVRGFTSSLGRDESLTGRTDIWATLLPIAMQKPILGTGIGGFWATDIIERYNFDEAHNGYLEVILQLGFIGLFLISMCFLSFFRKAQNVFENDYYWRVFCICNIFMIMVHNIAESSFYSLSSHFMAIILFLAVCSTRTALPKSIVATNIKS